MADFLPRSSDTDAGSAGSLLPVLIIVAVVLVATWPLWLVGVFTGWDKPPHAIWYLSLKEQLALGDLHARWLTQANAGLGSPSLYFYGFIPVTIAACIGLLLDSLGLSQSLLHGLGVAVAVFASTGAVGMYALMRNFVRPAAATIAALAFAMHPFALGFDVFERFGFAEHATIMLSPWLFAAAYKLAVGGTVSILATSAIFALMVMSHLPTAAIFALLVGTGSLALIHHLPLTKQAAALGWLAMAAILGILLASGYLSTILTQTSWIQVDSLTTGSRFDHTRNFIFTGANEPAILVRTWAVYPSLVAIGTVGVLMKLARPTTLAPEARRMIIAMLLMIGVTLFFMSSASSIVWRNVPPMQTMQFPWRFTTGLVTTTAILIGFGAEIVLSKSKLVLTAVALTGALVAAILMEPMAKRTYWVYAAVAKDGANAFPVTTAIKLRKDMPEYRPVWTAKSLLSEESLAAIASSDKAPLFITESSGMIKSFSLENDRFELDVIASESACIRLPHLYYPTWGIGAETTPDDVGFGPGPDGIMQVCVPPGRSRVILRETMTAAEQVGHLISMIALIAALLATYLLRRRHRHRFGEIGNA